jgi:aldehyde dehydrogenase (NAD+)
MLGEGETNCSAQFTSSDCGNGRTVIDPCRPQPRVVAWLRVVVSLRARASIPSGAMTTTLPAEAAAFVSADRSTKRLFIDGNWIAAASGRTFPSVNPSTGQDLCEIAEGDAEDVERAVSAARRALDGTWGRTTPLERQNLLLALADLVQEHYVELRMLESVDMGSPIGPAPQARSEAAVQLLRYFSGWTTKIFGDTIPHSGARSLVSYTVKEPVGVVGGIIPWNTPLGNALWKLGPALATGCAIVLKPAEEASLTALRLVELLTELDVPPGAVNVVTGLGEVAGAALVEHRGVDKIAFTGSTATGQAIVRAAAGNLKRVSLELGGKSPNIIFADADLARAIPAAAMGVFANSGQVCCAGTRVFVERPVYDEVVHAIAEIAGHLKIGSSTEATTQIGPLVSAQQLERVRSYIALGREEGARAVGGGETPQDDTLASGYFVTPTVFADVDDGMRIAREEIFGPVACVMPFTDTSEVVARANDTNYGLAAGVWTRDVGKAHGLARELKAGTVWVNTYLHTDSAVPFGGYKMSGWGRELGPNSLDEYLELKSVWIDTQ